MFCLFKLHILGLTSQMYSKECLTKIIKYYLILFLSQFERMFFFIHQNLVFPTKNLMFLPKYEIAPPKRQRESERETERDIPTILHSSNLYIHSLYFIIDCLCLDQNWSVKKQKMYENAPPILWCFSRTSD